MPLFDRALADRCALALECAFDRRGRRAFCTRADKGDFAVTELETGRDFVRVFAHAIVDVDRF